MKKIVYSFLMAVATISLVACQNNAGNENKTEETATSTAKIVSIGGTLTEVLADLGLESQIVAVDGTSTYPESMKSKATLGTAHKLNIEAIIALQPTHVVTTSERGLTKEQIEQLSSTGITVWSFDQPQTIENSLTLIQGIADSFKLSAKGQEIVAELNKKKAELPTYENKPKALFIYARGAGTLQVAGNNTPFHTMIDYAGGVNAANDFEQFKPLTAEALVKYNPDYIILFDSGLESLEGAEGLLKAPGVAQTNAGKNKKFIAMDGQYLSGFGPRVINAIKDLGAELHK